MPSRSDDATAQAAPASPKSAPPSTQPDMGVGFAIHNHDDAQLSRFLAAALSDTVRDTVRDAINVQLQHTADAISAQLERNTQAIASSIETRASAAPSLRITMPEYLERAQAVFDELLPHPPSPVANVPLHTAKDAQGLSLAPPAPRYLQHWSSFPQQLHQLWSQLDDLFGEDKCMPRLPIFANLHTDKLNEGNIDTWFKFHASQPAIRILSAAIARVRNQPLLNYDPLDPSLDWDDADDLAAACTSTLSPALASLQYAIRVVLGSQIDSAAPADRDGVDPYLWEPAPLTQSTLDMAHAIPAACSSSVDEDTFAERMQPDELQDEAIRLKKQFFCAIRTDQELIMRTSHGDSLGVAIIEIKKPELFCSDHVMPALHDAARTWYSPSLCRQAAAGKLPIRHALIHADRRGVCSAQAQYTFECIAQLWKYMAHKGLSYGMLSSVFVTLVLHIDWSQPDPAHSARFYCFEANDLKHSLAGQGARSFNLWHVLVAIVIWNAQTGVADKSSIVALGAKLVSDYDSFTSDDESATDDSDSNADNSFGSSDGSISSSGSYNGSSDGLRDEGGSGSNAAVDTVAASVAYASWLHADKVSRHTHPELFFAAQHARLNRVVRRFLRKPEPGYLWPASPHQMARALRTFLWLIKTDASFNNPSLLEAYMPKQVWAFDVLPCPQLPASPSIPDAAGLKRRCGDAEDGAASKRRRKHAEVVQLLTPPYSVEGDSPDRTKSA